MAIFEIVEGSPGNGKSLYTISLIRDLLLRNKKWYAKTGIQRKIALNIKLSEEYERNNSDWFVYWSDTNEIIKLRDVDIIWDEIATELDSRNFANLTIELKRFLSQYRKRGCDIYANTQDFSMVDVRARLMITSVKSLVKLCGSRDISSTKPDPKYIWGLIMIRSVENWREVDQTKKKYGLIPSFMTITKELISMYDTRQDIPLGIPAPYKHIERECELDLCKTLPIHKRIQHL